MTQMKRNFRHGIAAIWRRCYNADHVYVRLVLVRNTRNSANNCLMVTGKNSTRCPPLAAARLAGAAAPLAGVGGAVGVFIMSPADRLSRFTDLAFTSKPAGICTHHHSWRIVCVFACVNGNVYAIIRWQLQQVRRKPKT